MHLEAPFGTQFCKNRDVIHLHEDLLVPEVHNNNDGRLARFFMQVLMTSSLIFRYFVKKLELTHWKRSITELNNVNSCNQ